MAVTAYFYANFFEHLLNGDVAGLDSATIKLALTTSSYTPNQDTHDFFDDVTNEVSGTGYTAGGATLASKTVTQTNNVVKFDATDVTWSSSTITARRAVLYESTGTAGTSHLIMWIDFGADESSVDGDFTVQFHTDGIFTITAADASGYP